ncbi:MAG: type II toxin-antitoxin system VapC family toxin [Syntrophobacteraceae bacterium]
MREIILDTGPFVALLDRSERSHETCAAFFRESEGRFITTEPVLTEVIYLLGPSFAMQRPALEFILRGGAEVVSQTQKSLQRALQLMEKYRDVPMDFADATLVALAEERSLREVFSLDRRGFITYRVHSRKTFILYPEEA